MRRRVRRRCKLRFVCFRLLGEKLTRFATPPFSFNLLRGVKRGMRPSGAIIYHSLWVFFYGQLSFDF